MATKHFQVALDILQEATAVPATCYDSWAEYHPDGRRSRAFVAFYRSPVAARTESVLDLGCGTGTIAIALAGDVTGRVVGVAASAGMLQVAKEKSESFEWVRGTCDYPRGRAGRPRRMLLRHPSEPAARRRSAAGVRRRRRAIAPKGVFAFDIYQPNLDYLRTPQTIASPGP
jgi:SAM-dependent methyltransferase